MNLDYEITKQDYIDFNIYHMTHSVTMKRSLFIKRYIHPIIFLLLPIVVSKITTIPLWYWSSVFILTFVLWIAFYPKLLKKSVEKSISKMLEEGKGTGILGKHNFSITEEGMVGKTKFSETKYSLAEKVVESETHIFIYVSSVMAYIIPIRIFEGADDKNNFLNVLNSTIRSSSTEN